ncbi:MAG TPA: biopolymer transporter ExbD, partial [Chitinophagaceae bacterium]|nr:biopolymer transporter ExbD [Chitinophagaceae bacterium]
RLNPEEENYFGVASSADMSLSKREPLVVTAPNTRTTTVSSRDDGSLLIRMGTNGQIFVKINDGKSKDFLKIVDKTKAEGLSLAIAAYRQDYPTGEILISGANNAKYEDFQFIVDVLKARDELKYSLVTEN